MEDDAMMTLTEVAQYLRCHTGTLYRLLKTKQIPAFKLGSDWRFRRSEIVKWIEARMVNAPE